MDAEKLLRLLHIDEELIEICQWLNERHEIDTASRLIPVADHLTRLVAEVSTEVR